MDKKEFLAEANMVGERHSQYAERESFFTPFPFNDKSSGARRSFAYVRVLEKVSDSSHAHATVIAYDGKDFFSWCSDTFINGSMDRAKAMASIASTAKDRTESEAMKKLFGKVTEKGCRFWAGKKCSHHSDTMSFVSLNQDILDKLVDGFEGKSDKGARSVDQLMEKYAFKKHILLQGDKGSGKTYIAADYAEKHGIHMVYISGYKSMESTDLLGHLIQVLEEPSRKKGQANLFETPQSLVSIRWKDGPVTEAFRRAKRGEKVILMYDELLRTPGHELNILVGALAPIKGHYVLRTGKAIGIGDEGEVLEETIRAPIENLWVIATTNIGAQYKVDDVDSALEDRFRIVRKDSNIRDMEKILLEAATIKGYPAKETTDKLLNFFTVMEKLKTDGKVNKLINLRHLIEAVEFSDNQADIRETLFETRAAWVENDIDGHPIMQQEALVELALQKIFK